MKIRFSEVRSCVTEEVAALLSPSLTGIMVSVDVKNTELEF